MWNQWFYRLQTQEVGLASKFQTESMFQTTVINLWIEMPHLTCTFRDCYADVVHAVCEWLAFSAWSFTMSLMPHFGVQIMETLKRHPLCWFKWWDEGEVDKGWNVCQRNEGCFHFIHSYSNNMPIHYIQITVLDNRWLAEVLKQSEQNTKTRQWIRMDEGMKWRKVSWMVWSRLKFSCITIEPHYEMPITVSWMAIKRPFRLVDSLLATVADMGPQFRRHNLSVESYLHWH